MILVNFATEKSRRVAPRRSCLARDDFARHPHDIVSRNARRFIVFDSLSAYNFGARLAGNIVDSLEHAQHSDVPQLARKISYTFWPLTSPKFLYAMVGGRN